MGAGNPLLRSFDPDRFMPITYYVELTTGDVDPDEYSDLAFEDFVGNLCSSCEVEPLSPCDRRNLYDELSSAFRESGVTIAEGKRCYVITETGADLNHMPVAVIPSFRWEDFDGEPEAEQRWSAAMAEFRQESDSVVKHLAEMYGTSLSQRTGPWTSAPVVTEVTP